MLSNLDSPGQKPIGFRGVRALLRGEFDRRQLIRAIRRSALVTGTAGWARRRSDGAVEVVAYRLDGLADFLRRFHKLLREAKIEDVEMSESAEAENESQFRIRREQYLLTDQSDISRYAALGVDTSTRQFPALHKSGLLRSADRSAVKDAREYWHAVWGRQIDTAIHIAHSNLAGSFDRRVVPHTEYRHIWRFLNPGQTLLDAYSDKGLFRRLINTKRQPQTHLLCVDGRHYDGDDNWLISESQVHHQLRSLGSGIIKPTRSDNGRGVEQLTYQGEGRIHVGSRAMSLSEMVHRYRGNFMVQAIVEQHEIMAMLHPESLNTLRVVTLRWRDHIHHLLTFARFGTAGRVNDNAGTGGLCVGVDDTGTLHSEAINEDGQVYSRHPTTDVRFESVPRIPKYSKVRKLARSLHKGVPYFDLLSWDFGIGRSGDPVLIECNFRGASWLYQLATGRALFGHLTTDILQTIRDAQTA